MSCSWRRVVPTPRALTLFLVLVGFGLVLFIYLPRSFEERLVRSPRRRIPVLLAYEGEAEVHTFFCDTHTTQCPRIEFTPASGWQGGIPGVPDLHLLSAHYDTRVWVHGGKNRHYVRLLGVIKSEDADSLRFFCQMWYQELPHPIVVESDRTEIWLPAWDGRSPPGRYYRPFIFSCPVPFNVSSPLGSGPANVSLVAEPCACPPNSLALSKTPEKDPKRGIAVCVKGLDFPEDISARLVEWLELQFLLGADTVFFYIFQVHPKVDLILRYYRRFRRVQFERIQLPGLDEPHIPAKRRQYLANNTWQKRRHELVPYNDCYYRHIPTHEFVLLVDIDEVILPRRHSTWQELLNDIVSTKPKMLATYASLAVPNVYFFDHFEREKSWSWFLSRVTRSANFTRPGFAVKSFFTTNSSLAVFNHYTLVPLYGKLQRTVLLSKEDVQLNHYRAKCPAEMEALCKDDYFRFTVKDKTLWKFESKFFSKVKETKEGLRTKFLVHVGKEGTR